MIPKYRHLRMCRVELTLVLLIILASLVISHAIAASRIDDGGKRAAAEASEILVVKIIEVHDEGECADIYIAQTVSVEKGALIPLETVKFGFLSRLKAGYSYRVFLTGNVVGTIRRQLLERNLTVEEVDRHIANCPSLQQLPYVYLRAENRW